MHASGIVGGNTEYGGVATCVVMLKCVCSTCVLIRMVGWVLRGVSKCVKNGFFELTTLGRHALTCNNWGRGKPY